MLCPQLPSELSDITQPAALFRLKARLYTLFFEQTQTETIPFVFNPKAASTDAGAAGEWGSPAARAERAEFVKSTADDEIVVIPRGYTPPLTVGVIGSKPGRPLTPERTPAPALGPTQLHLLDILRYGGPSELPSSISSPGRSFASLPSTAATPDPATPAHKTPTMSKKHLKGGYDASLYEAVVEIVDDLVPDIMIAA